jgi:hypothetical protein
MPLTSESLQEAETHLTAMHGYKDCIPVSFHDLLTNPEYLGTYIVQDEQATEQMLPCGIQHEV